MNYTIALAGHPNSGKTTTFNRLVGGREKEGNWPGTTVERKDGRLSYQGQEISVVDLPGTYSLSDYSIDEQIAVQYLINEKPDVVAAVVDASHLERNLYLVVQLLEMGLNVILVLNMMDLARETGVDVNAVQLAEILKIPVVETVASRGHGISLLKDTILKAQGRKPEKLLIDYGELREGVVALENFLGPKEVIPGLNNRALAVKILEDEEDILQQLEHRQDFSTILQMRRGIEARLGKSAEMYIAERRYAFIKGLVKECAGHFMPIQERLTMSDKIDRVMTHRFGGIPIFLSMMYLLFSLVFKAGEPMVNGLDAGFTRLGRELAQFILAAGWPAWIGSFVSDGVIAGVGGVLSFLPYILLLFFGISILEDSGYLSRAAFIMDRAMHALGLHGKSFIPMLLGFGCNIPGIMATRTLSSHKDRILTILVLPLMSCAARLPVYTLFAGALFPRRQGEVVFSLYVLGIVLAIIMARIFRGFLFKEETAPLVMELPPYRMPNFRNTFFLMWLRAVLFIKKAGTLIFVAVVFIWALASLPVGVEYASEQSIIGQIGKFLAPALKPAGFGFWQAAVALLFGIFAKEAVIGSLATLYGVGEEGLTAVLPQYFTPLSGYAFLVMVLIYIPCLATVVVIKNETNGKWAALAVGYTIALGWLLSVGVYQVGRLIVG